jgi:excisionase family DNA binding protein
VTVKTCLRYLSASEPNPELREDHRMNINQSKTPTRFYTIAQAGNHERTVRRWIKRGRLVAHRINRLLRISEADFLTFLAAHRD